MIFVISNDDNYCTCCNNVLLSCICENCVYVNSVKYIKGVKHSSWGRLYSKHSITIKILFRKVLAIIKLPFKEKVLLSLLDFVKWTTLTSFIST